MTNAAYSRPGTASATNAYKETVCYDINGNIATMVRNGNSETGVQPFEMDDLVYVYERGTNKLMQVYDDSASPLGFKDDVNGTPDTDYDYGYDNRGNMTSDQNKGITAITYNHLNLPVEITFSGTNRKITYIYTATGEKVRKIVNDNSEGVTTDYLDGFQYRDGKMQLFPTSEGYVSNTRANGHNNYRYVYNYTDHLGNVRLSYGKNEHDELKIMEENHYYPYGLKHTNYNTDQKEYGKSEQGEQVLLKAPPGGNDTVNEVYKYKYNGCEYQDELGLNLYDMDMRDYDPAIGRWINIDPVTHFDQSPYMAFNGNPVTFADPSGADGIGLPPEAINTWHFAGGSSMNAFLNGGAGNLSNGDHMFGSSGDDFWGGETAYTGGALAWANYIKDNSNKSKGVVTVGDLSEGEFLDQDGNQDGDQDGKKGDGGKGKPSYTPKPNKVPDGAVRLKPKGGRPRYRLPDGDIIEWDGQHGEWERYNPRGKHTGVLSPDGRPIKDPVPGRKIDPSTAAGAAAAATAGYIVYKIIVGAATWECLGCGILLTP